MVQAAPVRQHAATTWCVRWRMGSPQHTAQYWCKAGREGGAVAGCWIQTAQLCAGAGACWHGVQPPALLLPFCVVAMPGQRLSCDSAPTR